MSAAASVSRRHDAGTLIGFHLVPEYCLCIREPRGHTVASCGQAVEVARAIRMRGDSFDLSHLPPQRAFVNFQQAGSIDRRIRLLEVRS
jgi:hypothetical protein